jgi:hypothetical protein
MKKDAEVRYAIIEIQNDEPFVVLPPSNNNTLFFIDDVILHNLKKCF